MDGNQNPIITEYLKHGFGTFNKSDFETIVFRELLKDDFVEKSDYEISIRLKINPDKVRKLRYEVQLKYGDVDDPILNRRELFAVLKGAKVDDTKIKFRVKSISLRKYIENKLSVQEKYMDSSFNADIIRLDEDDFSYLLSSIFWDDENTRNDIIRRIGHTTDQGDKERFMTRMHDFISGALENAVDNILAQGIMAIF